MLTLKFIFLVMAIGSTMAFLIALGGSSVTAQCSEPNCEANYGGEDCVNCSKTDDNTWLVVGILPIAIIIAVYLIVTTGSSRDNVKVFQSLGGEIPTRKEDGWLGMGDFKNGI